MLSASLNRAPTRPAGLAFGAERSFLVLLALSRRNATFVCRPPSIALRRALRAWPSARSAHSSASLHYHGETLRLFVGLPQSRSDAPCGPGLRRGALIRPRRNYR